MDENSQSPKQVNKSIFEELRERINKYDSPLAEKNSTQIGEKIWAEYNQRNRKLNDIEKTIAFNYFSDEIDLSFTQSSHYLELAKKMNTESKEYHTLLKISSEYSRRIANAIRRIEFFVDEEKDEVIKTLNIRKKDLAELKLEWYFTSEFAGCPQALNLHNRMQEAILKEHYDGAAVLRDEMQKITSLKISLD
jgi:hypothetical protein